MIAQMGDMLGQMNQQLRTSADQSGDQERLLAVGVPARP